jgi:hypothetical protein
MFKISKLFSLVLALVLMLSMSISVTGCGGEETTPKSETGSVTPKGGATFTGSIEITGKASSGTIQFSISGDGASITSVTITLIDLKTESFSAGSMNKEVSGSFPVTSGTLDASVSGIGEIEGRFTSPTKASGIIDITLEIPFSGPCELGEWRWSVEAE